MKKIFLLLASVFFSTMMFAQVLLWKDGEVIYSKNIDEVDKISFYEVEDFELVNDEIEMEYYGGWNKSRKWIHVEFSPKKSYGLLEYKSSNEDVVTVSYDGCLVARSIGEATITVKLIGTELEKICKVVVKGYEGTFKFYDDEVYLIPGGTYIMPHYSDSFDPYCSQCWEDLEWTSSNEKVATVDEDGKITAVAEGRSIITAKLKNSESEVSASAIVKVENVEIGLIYSGNSQDIVTLGVGGYKDVQVYFKDNYNYKPHNFKYEWVSSDKSIVSFTNANESTYYKQEFMGVSVGEAEVIVKIAGTEIQDTVKVIVNVTDPMTVQFYDVLWRDNNREYPLGYDINGDGTEDVVREIDLWLLGDNLDWVEENGEGKTVGEDYFIFVRTAWIFDGTYIYPFETHYFSGYGFEGDYLTEYNGEKYFSTYAASTSYFDEYSYCKYFEQANKLGEDFDVNSFKAEYGWPIKDASSYIYYWSTEEDNNYITGLVDGGSFTLSNNESDRGTTAFCVSHMDIDLRFFDEVANGLATEVDSETGELVYKEPYEMALMTHRYIYFDNRYNAPQQKAPAKMQGISEKALKADRILNIPLQMKLQDSRF